MPVTEPVLVNARTLRWSRPHDTVQALDTGRGRRSQARRHRRQPGFQERHGEPLPNHVPHRDGGLIPAVPHGTKTTGNIEDLCQR